MQHKSSISLIIALFSIVSSTGCSNYSNSTSQNTGIAPHINNTSRGHELFQQRCIGCHGLNGDARKINAADLQVTRLDSIGIITTIKNGRGKMPPFGNSFSDTDLAQLEQYVMTLRK